ncbi:hypothetical protein JOF36_007648 [Pseudonocardia parietis]|uniref:Uncharacterized protein n=1 Tax=Pseudonocardia parietis TaxID=570936 RepID=A0ABS4W6S7_9PSEU|nr:hypothetical protein [Pseudonocardia parietis]
MRCAADLATAEFYGALAALVRQTAAVCAGAGWT